MTFSGLKSVWMMDSCLQHNNTQQNRCSVASTPQATHTHTQASTGPGYRPPRVCCSPMHVCAACADVTPVCVAGSCDRFELHRAPVQVVQGHQHLPCECAHHWQRHSLVVKGFDQRQQVVPQHLKHHAHMQPMGARVLKAVQELAAVLVAVWVTCTDLAEESDLITRSLSVVRRTLLNLQKQRTHIYWLAQEICTMYTQGTPWQQDPAMQPDVPLLHCSCVCRMCLVP